MKKKLVLSLVVMGVLLTLLGCSSEDENTSTIVAVAEAEEVIDEEVKELVLVAREIACNYDPNYYPGSNHYIKNGSAEALFKADEKGSVQANLAKGYEKIDDHTWKIILRPEAKFWSGEPIEAQSVIDSLERSRETNAKTVGMLKGLDFSVIDPWHIEVKTERKNLFVPLNLSYMELAIINAKKAHDSLETMDMSGMYKVVEFEPKQRMVLEVNDYYYGDLPQIERVVHEAIGDQEARSLSILSKRADIAMQIPNESIPQLSSDKDIVLHSSLAGNTQTIYLNTQEDKFKDVRVRQALAWGLDRQELINIVTDGLSKQTTSWLSSNPKYSDQSKIAYPTYEFDKANTLLDEAGWIKKEDGIRYREGEPLKIKLLTWGLEKSLGEAIQYQWTKLGVHVEVQHGDYSLIVTAREAGEWDAFIEAWQTFGDEYGLMSGQFAPGGSANYSGYEDKKITDLLQDLEEAETEEEKMTCAKALNLEVAEQAPCIYLFPRVQTTAVNSDLKGFKPHFRQFENCITNKLVFE
jgi:peptide/nickel transport system substrate-binding protein